MEYKIHNGSLYDYNSGIYAGVLITEPVMKKLAALQAKHLHDVKRLLSDSKGSVFASGWTLHYPNGKQTTVYYIDTTDSVEKRIDLACMARRPHHVPLCFIADSMEDAKIMADEYFSHTNAGAA